MSAYAKPEHHTVTVTVSTEGDWTDLESVEFACSAPEDAPCRTYPDCDCERFVEDPDNPGHDTSGHPFTAGQECWVQTWFDSAARWEEPPYTGPDRTDATDCGVPLVSQHGHVSVVGFDESGPEWEWYGSPIRDDEVPAPLPTRAVEVIPGQEPLPLEVQP